MDMLRFAVIRFLAPRAARAAGDRAVMDLTLPVLNCKESHPPVSTR
jgi:hypothetical protein